MPCSDKACCLCLSHSIIICKLSSTSFFIDSSASLPSSVKISRNIVVSSDLSPGCISIPFVEFSCIDCM